MTGQTILPLFSREIGVNLSLLAVCILMKTNVAHAVDINVAAAVEGAVAIADSEYGDDSASLTIDGIRCVSNKSPQRNRWHAAVEKPHPLWVWIRFRQPARIARVVVHRADFVDYPVEFVGEYSSDSGRTFHTLFTVNDNQLSENQFTIERSFDPLVTDNFRLRILRSSHLEHPNSAQISEVEVFGELVGEKANRQKKSEPAAAPAEPLLRPIAVNGLAITSNTEN